MQHAPDFHPSYKAKVQAEYVGATLEATTGRKGLAVSGWRGMGLLTSNKADKEGAQEQGAGKANGKAGKSKGSAKAGQEAAVANGASGKAAAGAKGGKRAVEAAQLEEEEAAEARGQAPKAAAAAASKGAKEKQVKQSKKQKREPSPPPAAAEASEEDDEDEDEEELLGSFGTGGGSGDEEDEDFLDDALEVSLRLHGPPRVHGCMLARAQAASLDLHAIGMQMLVVGVAGSGWLPGGLVTWWLGRWQGEHVVRL